MNEILATRGASTKLREIPFTETPIRGVQNVIYRVGIEGIPCDGTDAECMKGEFKRGLHRISGVVWAFDGYSAETLLAIEDDIDLIIRYRGGGQARKRTIQQVMFLGDSTVAFPGINDGLGSIIGVPFRVQLKEGDRFGDRISDEMEVS